MDKGNTGEKTALQAEMLANRLAKRLRHLSKWAKRAGTDAFRLYDRDIPEIPLVLDLYGNSSSAEAFISGALYKRPYEKDQAEELEWLAAMKKAAAQATGLAPDNIIIKQREKKHRSFTEEEEIRTKTPCNSVFQYEKISGKELVREVREGGLRFRVNLSDYLDTGLFLDRRVMRRMVQADSGGKRTLNLFCYTGSFSVYAAAGGALSTASVDLSNTYLDWARDNFALNGFAAHKLRLHEYYAQCSKRTPAHDHTLIRADAAVFLERAAAAGLRWDTIILDPPAFSNSSMARADFDLKRDYGAILAQCMALLAEGSPSSEGGKLWFSAAARSFKAGAAEIEMLLAELFPGVTVTDISGKTTDEDFTGKKTPRAFVIKKN